MNSYIIDRGFSWEKDYSCNKAKYTLKPTKNILILETGSEVYITILNTIKQHKKKLLH